MVDSVLAARARRAGGNVLQDCALGSAGGFIAPAGFYTEGRLEQRVHREPWPWRWLHRLRGWPETWTEVIWHAPIIPMRSVRDSLPRLTARRGGIDFASFPVDSTPPRRTLESEVRELRRRVRVVRTQVALVIAPWLRYDRGE